MVNEKEREEEWKAEEELDKTVEESAETPTVEESAETQEPTATEEKTEEVATEEVTTETTESETAQPIEKKAKVTDFTGRYVQAESLTETEAIGRVRNCLQEFKQLDPEFLKRVAEKDAFSLEKKYIPVYFSKATAAYVWKTGGKSEPVVHLETREVSSTLSVGLEELDVTNVPEKDRLELPEGKLTLDVYTKKKKSFKECVSALKAQAEKSAPKKKAKFEFSDERYEIVYVPVLFLTCAFKGETYQGQVNLVNGECRMQYAVSEKVLALADKTMEKVLKRKRVISLSFFYALTFAVLAFVGLYKSNTTEGLTMAFVLGGIALFVLVCRFALNIYKREKFVDRAANKGKLPKTALAGFLTTVCLLAALSSVVLFALFVL